MGSTNTTVTPETWDGKYPLSDMPVGDTWTGNYSGTGCVGFAKMVLDATYGAGTSIGSSATWTSGDSASAKTTLNGMGIKNGDRITFNNRNSAAYGAYHAVIVTSISSTGINVYDCNRTGTNKIGKGLLSWSYISTQYTSMEGGVHHK